MVKLEKRERENSGKKLREKVIEEEQRLDSKREQERREQGLRDEDGGRTRERERDF